MTMIDLTERERAKRYYEAYQHENERLRRVFMALNFALLVLFFVWWIWDAKRQPIRERAADLESRCGLDADTAWELAKQGHGKTIAEYLQDK